MSVKVAKGYSLWLQPEGPLFTRLSGLIEALAQQFGTPAFEPHVTLLSGVTGSKDDVLRRAEGLCRRLVPFIVPARCLDSRPEYFRCFFVRLEETPVLLNAHARAVECFAQEPAEFLPHLSLVYGDLSRQEKVELASQLGRDWHFDLRIQQVHVYRTEGAPHEWYRVRQFPLVPGAAP
ncbi:MAG: 2'-5' RNA ligase family protein [Acidobacteriota bacterium]